MITRVFIDDNHPIMGWTIDELNAVDEWLSMEVGEGNYGVHMYVPYEESMAAHVWFVEEEYAILFRLRFGI